MLKDIRDSFAGNVIIPARPSRPNDDNGDNNGDDKTSYIDLSRMHDLQLCKEIQKFWLQKFLLDTMKIKIHLNYLLFKLL